ncbi:GtrA family protein [Massilia sp. IC2-476]|uniref:GtrA family protein n=1 Tax=Massilia sp. IC2-476 TaxID=2887199 RepID=UPI001D10C23A|nr:GtrA family protein [Massilia sp. IC2-476]
MSEAGQAHAAVAVEAGAPPSALHTARRQFARYVVVGLASNFLCYLAYLGLGKAGMDPKLAMSILYCVGVLQTFVFNRRWTFGQTGMARTSFLRYCAAYGAGYLVNLAALYLLIDRYGYPHQIVQAVMILVVAAMLFAAQKFWVFRAPRNSIEKH